MFPFLQQKAAIPSASATARVRQPPGELLPRQVLWGEQAALPAMALIAVTQGAGSSLGRHRVTGTTRVGRSPRKGLRGRHSCWGRGRSCACRTHVLWGGRQPQVERASAQGGWNPGIAPASLVTPGSEPDPRSLSWGCWWRDRGGWLWLRHLPPLLGAGLPGTAGAQRGLLGRFSQKSLLPTAQQVRGLDVQRSHEPA